MWRRKQIWETRSLKEFLKNVASFRLESSVKKDRDSIKKAYSFQFEKEINNMKDKYYDQAVACVKDYVLPAQLNLYPQAFFARGSISLSQ